MERISTTEMLEAAEEFKFKLVHFKTQQESILSPSPYSEEVDSQITSILKNIQTEIDKLLLVLSEKKCEGLSKVVTLRPHPGITIRKTDSGISVGSHASTASLPIQESDSERSSFSTPETCKGDLQTSDILYNRGCTSQQESQIPKASPEFPFLDTNVLISNEGESSKTESIKTSCEDLLHSGNQAIEHEDCTREIMKPEEEYQKHVDQTCVTVNTTEKDGTKCEEKISNISNCTTAEITDISENCVKANFETDIDNECTTSSSTCDISNSELCGDSDKEVMTERISNWSEIGVQTDISGNGIEQISVSCDVTFVENESTQDIQKSELYGCNSVHHLKSESDPNENHNDTTLQAAQIIDTGDTMEYFEISGAVEGGNINNDIIFSEEHHLEENSIDIGDKDETSI